MIRAFEMPHGVLHWCEAGDPGGRPVVFANSLGTDLRMWDPLLPHLPKGLRLIRFDKPGHGLSSSRKPPYTIASLAGDTAQLLDHLGVQQSVFVGTSIGGMIGQSLAVKRPDLIHALVLTNTAPKMGTPEVWAERIAAVETGGLISIADGVLERWFSARFRKKPEALVWRNMLTQTSPAGYVACCHALAAADLTETTRRLAQPALVVAGGADQASPPDVVRSLAKLLPQAQFHCLDGVGHLPSVEAPRALAALFTKFLKEIDHG